MPTEEISELIKLYLEGTCTPSQKKQVEQWYDNFQGTSHEFYNGNPVLIDSSSERSLSGLMEKIEVLERRNKIVKFKWYRIAAAAILFITLSTGLFLYINKAWAPKNYYANDISAGKNKAILTLSDGTKINLDDAKNGKLANQNGMSVTKTKDGQLVYKISAQTPSSKNAKDQNSLYNTITTPRGGQYQLILPDGSKVWLNAASSLKFPATFAGATHRKVEMSGEAYFEIAKNKELPFIVQAVAQEVEVLGTHFNINSYTDEPAVKTTLLEGSVRVSDLLSHRYGFLKPGEQAVTTGNSIEISVADAELAIAWKEGKFRFQNENIKSLMRKLARWYDVDIVYEGQMTNKDFSGSVSRFDRVSKILDVLESTNTVHFKVEGRRITVMP